MKIRIALAGNPNSGNSICSPCAPNSCVLNSRFSNKEKEERRMLFLLQLRHEGAVLQEKVKNSRTVS